MNYGFTKSTIKFSNSFGRSTCTKWSLSRNSSRLFGKIFWIPGSSSGLKHNLYLEWIIQFDSHNLHNEIGSTSTDKQHWNRWARSQKIGRKTWNVSSEFFVQRLNVAFPSITANETFIYIRTIDISPDYLPSGYFVKFIITKLLVPAFVMDSFSCDSAMARASRIVKLLGTSTLSIDWKMICMDVSSGLERRGEMSTIIAFSTIWG